MGSATTAPRAFGRYSLLILALFALVYASLAISSYRQKSAVWDEPGHLTAAYMDLTAHDYRVDPEHPPLLRLWTGLPLLAMSGLKLDTSGAGLDQWGPWLTVGQLSFSHRFCYLDNDCDRMLHRARFMILLLGILLGVLLFSWARELFGEGTAAVLLAGFVLEPNLLAHASVVSTDLGVTCALFGATYFAWRTTGAATVGNLLGLAFFFVMSLLSKYTGLLLLPLLFALLVPRAIIGGAWCWPGRRGLVETRMLGSVRARLVAVGALFIALLGLTYLAAWAAYGFRYAPAPGDPAAVCFRVTEAQRQSLPLLSKLVEFSDRHRLLPNGLTGGFLLGQLRALARAEYLHGEFRQTGWWYYFPVAILIKTPLALLALFFGGVVAAFTRVRTQAIVPARAQGDSRAPADAPARARVRTQAPSRARDLWFTLLPIVLLLGVAMTARINIGLRHVLPIYPFLILNGGWLVTRLGGRRGRAILLGLGALLVFEFARVAPNYLAAFNPLVGGPRGGEYWLVDSNLDWGQDLKGLKAWMDRNQVTHVNLSYFGTADPNYYGIDCTYLPGSLLSRPEQRGDPVLPGWVAVSVTNLRSGRSSPGLVTMCDALKRRKPDAVIGHSINLYRLDARPW